MSPQQFKVARCLIRIALAKDSVEVAYPKKKLMKDAQVAKGTVTAALEWLVSRGHLAELDPETGTESARWKLNLHQR